MTLAQLAVTVAVLGGLGLVASRFGLSAIPAYLLAGLLLGPNEPKVLALIRPSEVTEFVAQIGIVFLLFFLGLEFTLGRLARSRRHAFVGGAVDLATNAGLGLVAAIGKVGWILGLAVAITVAGKVGGGFLAGRLGGFTPRQSFNAGVALVAHGEFTIILAQIASTNESIMIADRARLVAFAGLYVLITATIGVVLMKESKVLGRRLFQLP